MELTKDDIELIQVLIIKRIGYGTSITGAREYVELYDKLEKMINERG